MTDRITPEAPDAPQDGAGRSRGARLAVLGLVGLAAGLLALFVATQPDPPAQASDRPTTTIAPPVAPTTTVVVVIQGEPVAIRPGAVLGAIGYPQGLYEITTGELALVTYGFGGPQGWHPSELWVSPDGDGWGRIELPFPSPVSSLQGIRGRLYAHGTDESGRPTVWVSDDGREWARTLVDEDPSWRIGLLGVTDDLTVAMGTRRGIASVEEELVRRFGEIGRHYSIQSDGSGTQIVVGLPLGITIASLGPEELGVTEDDLLGPAPGADQVVMATVDGTTWYQGTSPPGEVIGNLFRGPDGALWASAWNGSTGTTESYATYDGIEWERRGEDGLGMGAFVEELGDVTVGLGWDMELVLVQGDRLERSSLRGFFGNPDEWGFTSTAAGPEGIAAVAMRYVEDPDATAPEEPVLETSHQGYDIRVTYQSLTVYEPGNPVALAYVPRWNSNLESSYTFDLETGTLHVATREGEPLVTFTLDELTELERQFDRLAASASDGSTVESVLFTSADGCTWVTQELDDLDGWFVQAEVVRDGRAALVATGPWPAPDVEVRLYWADLPPSTGAGCD